MAAIVIACFILGITQKKLNFGNAGIEFETVQRELVITRIQLTPSWRERFARVQNSKTS